MEKKATLTWSGIYTGCWSLKAPGKLDKAATVTMFTLERSARALPDPYIQCFWSYDSIHGPGIPSPFTFANQKPVASQEILSAHFLSVRRPYHALFLPLTEPHGNLLLPSPLSTLHLMKSSMSSSNVLKMSRRYFFFLEVKCLMFRGRSESEVAEGEVQSYTYIKNNQTVCVIMEYKVELFYSCIGSDYIATLYLTLGTHLMNT